jgi:hypothetical protein
MVFQNSHLIFCSVFAPTFFTYTKHRYTAFRLFLYDDKTVTSPRHQYLSSLLPLKKKRDSPNVVVNILQTTVRRE